MQRRPVYFQVPAFIVPVSHHLCVSRIYAFPAEQRPYRSQDAKYPDKAALRPDHLSVFIVLSSYASPQP